MKAIPYMRESARNILRRGLHLHATDGGRVCLYDNIKVVGRCAWVNGIHVTTRKGDFRYVGDRVMETIISVEEARWLFNTVAPLGVFVSANAYGVWLDIVEQPPEANRILPRRRTDRSDSADRNMTPALGRAEGRGERLRRGSRS